MKKAQFFCLATLVLFSATGSLWAADQWQEINPANAPPSRVGHTMAELNGDVYLFGGQGSSGLLNDLWKFSGDQWQEINPANAPPPALWAHRGGAGWRDVYLWGAREFWSVE